MKWLVVGLLLINVLYLGWEIEKETSLALRHKARLPQVSADATKLQLISELTKTPQPRRVTVEQEAVTEIGTGPVSDQTGPDGTGMNVAGNDMQLVEQSKALEEQLLLELMEITPLEMPTAVETGMAICYSYGPFAQQAKADELTNWFVDHAGQVNQRTEYEDDKELFWIYLAPQTNRDQAVSTLQELKQKGIQDYHLIRQGTLENAISLGLFSSQASVNRRLSELNAKGYQPLVVPYHDSSATRIYWVDVMLQNEPKLMHELMTGYPARFNTIPVDCKQIAINAENS